MYQKTNVIQIKFSKAEEIQDLNVEAIASAIVEEKKLLAARHNLISIDARDGIFGNDMHINKCKELIDQALKDNDYQLAKDKKEKQILEKVVPLFPEAA